jgi:diacylglycerol kinase
MKNRSLKKSFIFAFRGIYKAFQTESNMRRHIIAALLAILFSFLLEFNLMEWAIMTLTIFSVMITQSI